MFTRISSGLVLGLSAVALSGCGLLDSRSDPETGALTKNVSSLAEAEQAADREIVDDGKVACAVSGAAELSRSCLLEQTLTEKGMILTVKHPDGGFRKLQVVKDGRGVIAADGADQAKVKLLGTREIEVTLAGDKYILPAKRGSAAKASEAEQAQVPAAPKTALPTKS